VTLDRQVRLGLAGLAAAVLALNVVGFLRYPGGPLRDPSDDGPLWLDLRPADQGSVTVGNTQPSAWAIAGHAFYFGLLSLHNPTDLDATLEAVTPLDVTPGLAVTGVYVRRPDVPASGTVGFGPAGELPDDQALGRDYVQLPATVPASGDGHAHDLNIIVVLSSSGPGAFGFARSQSTTG
jgi:hypothetical protein